VTTTTPNSEKKNAATATKLNAECVDYDEKKEDEDKTPPEEHGKTAAKKIDTAAVSRTWSPQRDSRREIKVRSLEDGNLRGGDYVLNDDGDGEFLSVTVACH